MLDLLIKNAEIVDGSGNPSYKSNIGIINNEIKILRNHDSSNEAKKNLDWSPKISIKDGLKLIMEKKYGKWKK